MAKSHFKLFKMEIDVLFDDINTDDPDFAQITKSRRLILDIYRRFFPLDLTIKDVLRAEKISTNPPLTIADWRLSANPTPRAEYQPPSFILVDVPYDPMELEHLKADRVGIGQMAVDFVDQALAKIAASPDLKKFFPFDVIRRACALFEERGYIYPFKVTEKMIPGTKVKGRIDIELSAEGTQRIFSASYRGKPLMRQVFRTLPTPDLAVAGQFHGFSLYDGKIVIEESPFQAIKIGNTQLSKMGGEIVIQDHPALLAVFEEKGWLGIDERKTLAKDSVTAMVIDSLLKDSAQGQP